MIQLMLISLVSLLVLSCNRESATKSQGPDPVAVAPVTEKSVKSSNERLRSLKAELAAKEYDLELQEAELAKHVALGKKFTSQGMGVGPAFMPRRYALEDKVNLAKVEVRRLETMVKLEAEESSVDTAK